MAWDVSKTPSRIRPWEAIVFACLPLLIGATVALQWLGVSHYLVGFVFLLIPFDFAFCVIAFDFVRQRF